MWSKRYGIELLLIFSSVGCVSLQDNEYQIAQKCRAHRAWWEGENRCSSNPCSSYSKGWRTGYADVLQGGDGTPPPVPPAKYWSHKYQSENGRALIADWFHGYEDGAATAMSSCRGRFHEVPVSNQLSSFTDASLDSDLAPFAVGKTTLSVQRTNPAEEHAQQRAETAQTESFPADLPAPSAPETPATLSDPEVPAALNDPDVPAALGDLELPSALSEPEDPADSTEIEIPPAPKGFAEVTAVDDSRGAIGKRYSRDFFVFGRMNAALVRPELPIAMSTLRESIFD